MESDNGFYGYMMGDELAGVIEIEQTNEYIDINSLVVSPAFFRYGIGRELLKFVFNTFDVELFLVETGVENTPAVALYQKLGFKEVKQWDTDFGVRKVLFERRLEESP
ncbi:MAG: N-acetyltransferase [Bacteroidota bacterium]